MLKPYIVESVKYKIVEQSVTDRLHNVHFKLHFLGKKYANKTTKIA